MSPIVLAALPGALLVAREAPRWPRVLPWLLLLAAIATIVLLARRLHAARRQRPRDAEPAIAVVDPVPAHEDERIKLMLWTSGGLFWDYDPPRRHLRHLHADTQVTDAARILLLNHEGDVPSIHRQDLPHVLQALRQHLAGETPMFVSEMRMDLSGGGTWTWIRARGCVIERDESGQPLRIAGTARDITELRHAEHNHRIASEVLRNMSEAVAILDCNYNFLGVNAAFSRITGYSEKEVIDQPLSLLNSRQHAPDLFGHIHQSLERDGCWSGEAWQSRKDGEEILCRLETSKVQDTDTESPSPLYVLVLSDITEQKHAELELRYLANYDALTSLPNRSLLTERLGRAIARARREGGRLAVLFIDLDRFKHINDSLGHATGDRILRAIASRVQQSVGVQHTVARLGGDEFTVLLEDIAGAQEAEQVAQRIIDAFDAPLALDERLEPVISPSIGISLFPDHARTPTELLKHADTAMYQAKAFGRHTYQTYSEAMDEKNRHRALLVGGLRRALERDELSLAYQPRLCLQSQRIVGAEALMRWHSHEFGNVSPALFIPLAEESGLILELGTWALHQACRTLRQWHDAGFGDLCMSVNVSSLQLQRGDLPGTIARVLGETGLDARHLELELTESVIMSRPAQNADILRACRELGVSLAIDDFGTGYSSLAYLKRLPITTLKIDREFIGDLTRDSDDEAITSTIIAMAHSLSKSVVAEGVETAEQLAFLRQHRCDEIQGYYVCHALPAAQCLDFIRAHGAGKHAGATPFPPLPARLHSLP